MREHYFCDFIFSSTVVVYGLPEIVPIAETAIGRPIHPYGETKLIVERMVRDFNDAYGIN